MANGRKPDSIFIHSKRQQAMEQNIERLGKIFREMVENYNSFGDIWKNIPLAKEAFAIMLSLPDALEGEFDTPQEKAGLLSQMLDQMEETLTPRFCLEVRRYMLGLDASDEDNSREIEMLQDYINLSLPMEEYCSRYRKFLKFDPVERTEKWEESIYEVEAECAEILKNEPKGMGSCFGYWSTKAAVLSRHGISWKSPSMMNPGVMFD